MPLGLAAALIFITAPCGDDMFRDTTDLKKRHAEVTWHCRIALATHRAYRDGGRRQSQPALT